MSTDHNFFEEKGEPKRIRTEVPLLTSLTPYAGPYRPTGGDCEHGGLFHSAGPHAGKLRSFLLTRVKSKEMIWKGEWTGKVKVKVKDKDKEEIAVRQ